MNIIMFINDSILTFINDSRALYGQGQTATFGSIRNGIIARFLRIMWKSLTSKC